MLIYQCLLELVRLFSALGGQVRFYSVAIWRTAVFVPRMP